MHVVVWSDWAEIQHRVDLDHPHPTENLLVPWTKPASHVRRAILVPSSAIGQSRRMEGEERDRLILAIATARSWLQGLVRGAIHDVAELAARHNRTLRSIRMTLSLAFLDPTLIDAACAGTLPRGYGVTRTSWISRRASPINGAPSVCSGPSENFASLTAERVRAPKFRKRRTPDKVSEARPERDLGELAVVTATTFTHPTEQSTRGGVLLGGLPVRRRRGVF